MVGRTRTALVVLASSAVLVTAVLVALTSTAGSYAVRLTTAVVAVVLLLRRAGHWPDRASRRCLILIAAALIVGAASGALASVYLVVTSRPVPAANLIQLLYLMYAPLTILALASLPRRPTSKRGLTRAMSDAAAAASALTFLTLTLICEPGNASAGLTGLAATITDAYAILPGAVLAAALSVHPLVAPARRTFTARVAAGMALLGTADLAYCWQTWHGGYSPASWAGALHEVALLALAFAPLAVTSTLEGHRHRAVRTWLPTTSWTAALPYAGAVLAGAVAAHRGLTGHSFTRAEIASLLAMAGAVVCRRLADNGTMRELVAELSARENAAQQRLRRDELTRLPNRLALNEHLDAVLGAAREHAVAVAIADIRQFRTLNDNHGHAAGDELLRRVGERLATQLPRGTFVARAGADEFAVVAPCRSRADDLVHRMSRLLGTSIQLQTGPWALSANVGLTLVPPGAPAHRASVLVEADLAVQTAKDGARTGGPAFHVLDADSRKRARRTAALREAIARPNLQHFRVVFQPIATLDTGRLVAAETLLRWRDPDLGEVSPAEFVPLAEQTGSIAVLTDFVLDSAASSTALWQASAAGAGLRVGVNLSPRDLSDPDLPERVFRSFSAYRVPLPALTVEVTEEGLLEDFETAAGHLAQLQARGVRVAVDDFGTGYASLRYLRWFRPDVIKIDREFVQAASVEPTSRLIVAKVNDIAHGMRATCLAEGIETAESFALLRDMGLDLGQGYHIARPMSLSELRGYLGRDRLMLDASG